MRDILEFILKNITTVPDEVQVEERAEEGVTNYVISVNAADVGRIIGKEGKVIKAIRTIMRVIAIQKGVRVRVSVLSDEKAEVAVSHEDEVIVENSAPVATETPVTENSAPVAEAPSDEITVEV